jgi:hypothetical protein
MFHFPNKQTEKQRNTEKLRFLSQFDRKKVPNSANTEEKKKTQFRKHNINKKCTVIDVEIHFHLQKKKKKLKFYNKAKN